MSYWITVVDDEALSLTNARIMLSEENMRVSCLRSGSDLLKYLEKNTPDLILLDILMPEMNGFETLEAVRNFEDREGKAHIPVIFLTGENDSAVEQQGLSMGASDFIRKPFNKEILVKRIENTIKNSKTIETLTEEATVDKLTGFLNKTYGTARISKLCSMKSGALMIMDLDSFKLVNDLFGHEMGDKVLMAFSDIIRKNTREADTVSRIGGDEILAFFEDLSDEIAVASITLRLNTQLQEEAVRLMGDDHGIPLGISIGVAMVPTDGRDYTGLFVKADSALSYVKQNGKHGYCMYDQLTDGAVRSDADPALKLERTIRILEERNDVGGALVFGSDSFGPIYKYIMRFYKRYGGAATLVLFTLSSDESADNMKRLKTCTSFTETLKKTLRMSDIVMQVDSDSFFAVLTERTRTDAESAINRVVQAWNGSDEANGITVGHVYQYIETGSHDHETVRKLPDDKN